MKFLATLLSLALLVVSCGEDSDSDSKSDMLSGKTWTKACYEDDEGDYVTTTMVFNGEQADGTLAVYSDESCDTPAMSVRVVQNYEILGLADGETDVYNINYTLKQAYATVFDDDTLTYVNDETSWGYSDWEKGVAKDIINRASSEGGEIDFTLDEATYSNFKLTADQKLYTSSKDDNAEDTGKTEATRRTAAEIDLTTWLE